MQRACSVALSFAIVALGLAGLVLVESSSELVNVDFAEAQRARELERAREAAFYVRDEQFRIVTELEQELISLGEAIEQARPLNDHEPTCLQVLRRRHPDRPEEALVGYQLLVAAFRRPRECPQERRAFLQKLWAQLQGRFGSDVVPPPPLVDAEGALHGDP